jgi:hypothetical protein
MLGAGPILHQFFRLVRSWMAATFSLIFAYPSGVTLLEIPSVTRTSGFVVDIPAAGG